MVNQWVFELPHYYYGAGGIMATLQLAEEVQRQGIPVHIRFQHTYKTVNYSSLSLPYSVGLPDKTFPESAVCITYSDTPFADALAALPQVRKKAINMLSYGMAINRESHNIKAGLTVFTTSKRTQLLIEAAGGTAHITGHGHDFHNFYPEPGIKRRRIGALLYNAEPDKKYPLGVQVMDTLCGGDLLEGVLTFGAPWSYEKYQHPKKLIRHVDNASRAEIREIFSRASLFIMPSVTEGFSLTPIESTLCGCPAVLSDGAFGDVYFDGENCLRAGKGNFLALYEWGKYLLRWPEMGEVFRVKMLDVVKNFSWEKAVKIIREVLGE